MATIRPTAAQTATPTFNRRLVPMEMGLPLLAIRSKIETGGRTIAHIRRYGLSPQHGIVSLLHVNAREDYCNLG
jgi:hypothetical protein